MAYKRKAGGRSTASAGPRKRRYAFRRKTMIPRSMGALVPAKVNIQRTTYSGVWQVGTASTADFWRYVSLTISSMNNFGELANVFDEYRINAIKVTYRPRIDSTNQDGGVGGSTGIPLCYMHTIVDPGSTVLPSGVASLANLNTFLENGKIKARPLNKPVSIYFKPKVQDQLLGGGTSSRVMRAPFIKTTETGVDHRGFHAFVSWPNFGAVNTYTLPAIDVFITYYVTFKNLK